MDNGRFRSYRNTLNQTIKEAKSIYYKNQIKKNSSSSKHLWNTIKQLCPNSSKKKNEIKEIVNKNGEKITNPLEIANTFVDYYATVGKNLAESIKKPNRDEFKHNTRRVPNSIYLQETNEAEIQTIISLVPYKIWDHSLGRSLQHINKQITNSPKMGTKIIYKKEITFPSDLLYEQSSVLDIIK
ncbi:hypothetical protein NQ317_004205 [Molorchus minor]|uniref:Uncharacterized protein n=1 Tax=Molorchus minor TaxID=1323400 RepID=A0ABQ9IX17_9CUCU|nr:hypothetical protein NQ317_004205 [Molorchus minor]